MLSRFLLHISEVEILSKMCYCLLSILFVSLIKGQYCHRFGFIYGIERCYIVLKINLDSYLDKIGHYYNHILLFLLYLQY